MCIAHLLLLFFSFLFFFSVFFFSRICLSLSSPSSSSPFFFSFLSCVCAMCIVCVSLHHLCILFHTHTPLLCSLYCASFPGASQQQQKQQQQQEMQLTRQQCGASYIDPFLYFPKKRRKFQENGKGKENLKNKSIDSFTSV